MDSNALNVFEEQLRAETLQSERLRALVMAVVTACSARRSSQCRA